jgi:FkbM family methyltransferase
MGSQRKHGLVSQASDWTARQLRRMSDGMLQRPGIGETWIDVGAHYGETTLKSAVSNPGLKVYAFEPNVSAAAKLMGRAANYFVMPMAVSEENGIADFYINALDAASSLLPLNEATKRTWLGGEGLEVSSVVPVPTVRIDTFMGLVGINKVDFLKIDAQGADFSVVRSAGSRLADIRKIMLEADVTQARLYEGSAGRSDIVAYLEQRGFTLTGVETQSYGQEENLTFVNKRLSGERT